MFGNCILKNLEKKIIAIIIRVHECVHIFFILVIKISLTFPRGSNIVY